VKDRGSQHDHGEELVGEARPQGHDEHQCHDAEGHLADAECCESGPSPGGSRSRSRTPKADSVPEGDADNDQGKDAVVELHERQVVDEILGDRAPGEQGRSRVL
jgi:hypothetical protein